MWHAGKDLAHGAPENHSACDGPDVDLRRSVRGSTGADGDPRAAAALAGAEGG